MTASNRTIFVVDDDAAIRESLQALLESIGLTVEAYGSGQAFRAAYDPDQCGCLVIDLHLSTNGLDILDDLSIHGVDIPAILITWCCDPATRARAAQAGVVALLEKPFEDQLLLDTIERAFEQHTRPPQASA